ncbi:unnamed protein product [Rotaria sp. Silwood2]|nr:unnamed protein product [Rotaria sp. Silwood2]
MPSDEKTKKLRNLKFDKNGTKITCIEHLSNEIFYEIFDYLDGCDIFDTFSNLNIRFKCLILYSSLPIKIHRSISSNQITEYHYQKLIIPYRHRIISFHINDKSYMSFSFSLHMIDESFSRLESLVLYKIQYDILIYFLPNLITLPRLFSLKIGLNDGLRNFSKLMFDELETLIKKSFSYIRVLRFTASWDSSYLDADRWEQLILKHIPHLRILDFKYTEGLDNQLMYKPYHLNFNRFLSPFWIQRRWFFELKICINVFPPATITYSIQPLKKQWYEWHDDANSNQFVTCSTLAEQKSNNTSFSHLHLTVEGPPTVEYYRLVQGYICSIAALVQFTSLHIDLCHFSISILIQFLNMLPNLDSLTITSEFPEKAKILSKEQINMFHFVSSNNKITKVNLEQMTELDQIHIIMDLCFHMCDLQVKCRNIFDGKWLIRYVINKRNTNFIPHLCSICLWISEANDEMMSNLQIIIDIEKLIDNYTIKRICDKIYLRWNEHL